MTSPIIGANGASQGAVAGDLLVAQMSGLLGNQTPDQEVHVANTEHLIVLSSDWGPLTNDQGMGARGTLRTTSEIGVVNDALTTGAGSSHISDYRNDDVFAGYAPINNTNLVVVASTDIAAGLAPAYTVGH